ncbi:MAG: DUF5682 family protein [Acidobacteriota bacterium]
MNARLGELTLSHVLPVAVYSYFLPRSGEHAAHGSWAPFCAYSPEWVAMTEGQAAGARVRFIDLPAWDKAFASVENRYSDHERQVSATLQAVAIARGFDSTDALWDHLFELCDDPVRLDRELDSYFEGFRGKLETREEDRDTRREAYMARWIDWALAAAPPGATVLVVCGGFHAPALRALAGSTGQRDEPDVPVPDPELARTGSYLVPFSFKRLDAFTGYASGMPSPAFYQELWERGDAAGERMLFAAIAQLRAKGQRVSTADAIAASELAHGLAQLRGHRVPARTDVLDGLCGALVKDALRAPPPWTGRGMLAAGTDPYLVEIIRAFSGEARGRLAEGTPRPPLVDDIERECAEVGLAWTERATTLAIDIFDASAARKRQVLYRLMWLEIPGVELVSRADLRRGRTRHTETWKLQHTDATTVAMIEAAVYGATLEAAALARVDERLRTAQGVVALVTLLELALRAGFHHMVGELCAAATAAVEQEPQFANAGRALARLAGVAASEPLPPGHGVGPLVRAVVERALWLLEAIDGADAPFDREITAGIFALRSALDLEIPDRDTLAAACVGVWTRRAAASDAPPGVRGACMGALWTHRDHDYTNEAETMLRGMPSSVLGECLAGLFALAREVFRESPLLTVVDARLGELDDDEFLRVLPSLRRAFAFFPPHERRELARRLLDRHHGSQDLLAPIAEPDAIASVRALEDRWFATARRYALLEDK